MRKPNLRPFAALLLAVLLSYLPLLYRNFSRTAPRSPPAKYRVLDDFFGADLHARIISKFKEVAPFETTIDDQTSKYQSFGEHMARNEDGTCPHPFLVPYKRNASQCVLVARMDVGRHQLLTGGWEGLKDTIERQATRMTIFEKYWWDALNEPEFQELVNHPSFQEAAKDICGKEFPIVQPYEMLLALQAPGSVSPLHLDSAFYIGASRFLFPLWLLVAMEESGLYKDRRIPQVQAVTYVHNTTWKPEDGGEFLWFHKGVDYDPLEIAPLSGRAVFVDGTQTVHGSKVHKPNTEFPILDKDTRYSLEYLGNEEWAVIELDSTSKRLGRVHVWKSEELRWAVVFRARCYRNKEEMERHDPREELDISMDSIKATLAKDLKEKHNVQTEELSPLDLALMYMDKYIKLPYPVKNSWIPFNFCVLPKLGYEWLTPLFSPFCN